ncbi:MAG: hypothetical protein WBM13_07590 [Bacteroidia bacterium]
MKYMIIRDFKRKIYLLISSILLICSCNLLSPGISQFDHYSYVQTTSAKVDVLNLMNLANEDYQLHQKEINEVNTTVQKIVEYEKHRPKNDITIQQWDILTDTARNLYGGFIVKWKRENRLKEAYLTEKKKQIGAAFDQIAELESKKIKPKDIK